MPVIGKLQTMRLPGDRFIYFHTHTGSERVAMIKKMFNFRSCTATAGKPFEGGPKCPLYLRTNKHLESGGWQQIYYNPNKTASGDLCNTKYKRLEKSEAANLAQEVLSMLEINIEGTKRTCTLTAVLSTYNPKDILRTIDHECEGGIMNGLCSFWNISTIDKVDY